MLTKVIEQSKIDHFTKWFDRADKIVIVSHVGPDGDAIGSSLGLWHFFSSQGKTANVIVPNAFPDFLKWMPGSKDVLLYDRYKEFADKLIAEADVICCLDFNAIHRIDAMGDAVLASPARKILIDHHLHPEDFCKIIISHPEISSTSELVFRLICRMGYFSDISREGAECIYTGMMTDTGGFTYNSNNREIYFIISELLSKGIDKNIGFAIGSVIFIKLSSSLQPSIFAASSNSLGIPARNVFKSNILNGICIAMYTSISPTLVSIR